MSSTPGPVSPGSMQTIRKGSPGRAHKALACIGFLLLSCIAAVLARANEADKSFEIRARTVDACSCPLFCPCFFNTESADGHECKFNSAFRFEEGSNWGDVDLSGVTLWASGDLSGDFADGTAEWAVVTFDRPTTPAQREALVAWWKVFMGLTWDELETAEDDIVWEGDDPAHVELASGTAAITLERAEDSRGQQVVVLHAPLADSHSGLELAYSTHHYNGASSFRFERRHGYATTFTMKGEVPGGKG